MELRGHGEKLLGTDSKERLAESDCVEVSIDALFWDNRSWTLEI